MRRRRSRAFTTRKVERQPDQGASLVDWIRLVLLVVLAYLLVEALRTYMRSVFPLAGPSPTRWLLPGMFGAATLGALFTAFRLIRKIRRGGKEK